MNEWTLWSLLFVFKLVIYVPFMIAKIWPFAIFGIIDLIAMIVSLWHEGWRNLPVFWEQQPPLIR